MQKPDFLINELSYNKNIEKISEGQIKMKDIKKISLILLYILILINPIQANDEVLIKRI